MWIAVVLAVLLVVALAAVVYMFARVRRIEHALPTTTSSIPATTSLPTTTSPPSTTTSSPTTTTTTTTATTAPPTSQPVGGFAAESARSRMTNSLARCGKDFTVGSAVAMPGRPGAWAVDTIVDGQAAVFGVTQADIWAVDDGADTVIGDRGFR